MREPHSVLPLKGHSAWYAIPHLIVSYCAMFSFVTAIAVRAQPCASLCYQ